MFNDGNENLNQQAANAVTDLSTDVSDFDLDLTCSDVIEIWRDVIEI